jgi:hypothetical protein
VGDSPIQNLDSFDVVGRRVDGGIDLVIVASGPIDGSQGTLNLLKIKISNYIDEVSRDDFLAKNGRNPGAQITICVVCPYPVDPQVFELIEAMRPLAQRSGADIIFRSTMG